MSYYLLNSYVVFGPDVIGCISGVGIPLSWQRAQVKRTQKPVHEPSLASGYQVIPVRR